MIRVTLALCASLWAASVQAAVDIQQEVSPGGIDFWLVEETSIPFVALEISIEGGGALDRPGKRGAVNLMMALIEEGSADMDARTFQAAREALAASYVFDAYDDSVSISARFLTENQTEAVALLRQALTDPRFDEDAVERVRAQVLSNIASDAQRPNRIAGDAFYAAAFPDHPYGSDMSGTVESVAALTRDDLIQAHLDAVTQDRVHVAVVGDTDAATAGAMIDELLGDLPRTSPPPSEDVEFGLAGGVTVIDYPTPQSVALFGHSGLERDDPDFFAAYVLNHILGGGGFESRLMTEVREKRGLTYGVSTYLVPRVHAELVIGSVASSNDRIAEAIDVIRAEWARIAEEGVTQEELDAAKTYITGEYPLRFDGNGPIAEIMVGMQRVDLGPDYVVNRNDFVEAVTLDDVNRVAAYLLRPEALHFTVVGQPEGLETGPLPPISGQ
ncbi:M16 family metallopeptidase [Flavimaricola marinus]|uniref:Peptidase M16 inactive domain protein n=1 Tax=Flavimaricola marinus TaxID=1819565 RepID=A0A238LJD0_9RHOB|nr:pitrilysin family protein [Flavimaricola marinus]SMY09000.1 Peptidase M16 inactive domain protein [Flavimaricola marinus]